MAACIKAPLAIGIPRSVILAGLFVALCACHTSQQGNQQNEIGIIGNSGSANAAPSEASADPQAHVQPPLPPDTELLHNVIVAFIATQRNQPETALAYISRAARQSGNYRLVTESIAMAMATQQFQQAIDLGRLLEPFGPDDYLLAISIARAYFRLGEFDSGLALLTGLAEKGNPNHVHIFPSIAELLTSMEDSDLLNRFGEWVESRPDSATLQLIAAFVANKRNQPEQYVARLWRTLELEPNREFPAILLLMQLQSGNNGDATEERTMTRRDANQFAMERLQAYPEHLRFRLQYIRHLIEQGHTELALEQLRIALDKNPDTPQALFTTAVIYFERDDLSNARDYFIRYLQLAPDNDQARIYLSDIEYQQGDYVAALNYLYGVTFGQYYLDAQIRLALILAKRYEVDTGISHLRQIEAVADEDRIRLILQQDALLREYDRYEQAKQVLDEGLEWFPDHPDLLYNRGLVSAKLDRLDLHERDMRKLIELEPNNAHAYNAFGYVLADKTDRLEEAMTLIKKANALLPDNPFILDSMGWVHFRLGNNRKAIEYLTLALDARQDAEIAAHLGEVLWVTGEREEARKIWQKGIEWDPGNSVLQQTIERLSP